MSRTRLAWHKVRKRGPAVRPAAFVLSLAVLLHTTAARAEEATSAVESTAEATPKEDPWEAVPGAVTLTAENPPPKKKHRGLALGAVAGIYLSFSTWAWFAWYADHPPNQGFEFGGDGLFEKSAYAGGSDKLGHAWSTYVLGRMTSQVLRFGGWDRRHAAVIGAGLASGLFTLVEYQDAYYYEFSVGDLVADVLGGVVGAVLESNARADALFDFRVEYFPSDEYRAIVSGDNGHDPDLKALNFAEDYSGQTYLAALHLAAFDKLQDSKWTAPLEYVDAVVGFQTNKYRPHTLPGDMHGVPTQELSLGVSLNLQKAVDKWLGSPGGTGKRIGHQFLHAVTETINVPFTSFRPLQVNRRCAGDAGCEPD